MNIAIGIGIAIIYTVLSLGYVSYVMIKNDGEKKENNKIKFGDLISYIKLNKWVLIGHIVLLVLVCALSVELNLVFKQNLLIHNVKIIVLILFLTSIAMIDRKLQIIPNKLLLVAVGARLIIYLITWLTTRAGLIALFKDDLMGLLMIFIFAVAVLIFAKNSIGMGDIKLLMVMAMYQGYAGVFASIFLSLFLTSVVGICLIIARKKKRKDAVPFGPFLLAGTFISVVLFGM